MKITVPTYKEFDSNLHAFRDGHITDQSAA